MAQDDQRVPDSHDVRLARVRRQLQHDRSVAILAQVRATSFAVWFYFTLIKTWYFSAQRLVNCTRWMGAVHPWPPATFSPLADGAGQPSAARAKCGTSVKQTPQVQHKVGQGSFHPQRRPESKPSRLGRADTDSTREAARTRVVKIEKAFGVMGDIQGPAVECFFLRARWRDRQNTGMSNANATKATSRSRPSLTEFHHDLRRVGVGPSLPSPPLTSRKDNPNDLALQHAKIVRHLCSHAARARVWRGTGADLAFALANWRKNT